MGIINKDTRDEVKKSVLNFFSEECEIELSKLDENTNIIRDLEGDSLMFLELLEIFKKKYSLDIELKTIGKYIVKHPVESIGQIIDMTLLIIQYENKITELN
jgi:acyl carrier protein